MVDSSEGELAERQTLRLGPTRRQLQPICKCPLPLETGQAAVSVSPFSSRRAGERVASASEGESDGTGRRSAWVLTAAEG